MSRPSYFQAIAPTAGTAPAARLAPPPPLFRPSGAPAAFVAIDSWSEPSRQGAGGRPAAPEERATRPNDAAVAPMDRRDSPVSEMSGGGDRTRPLALGRRRARRRRRASCARCPASARRNHAANPGGLATTRLRALARPRARPTPARPIRSSEPERPRLGPQSAARAPAAPPIIMPHPPAPRPSAKPVPSGPAGGVHIGTLEVRVVAPAGPARAAPPPAGRPRSAARAPAPRQAWGAGRLSRGFAVFGLGQS